MLVVVGQLNLHEQIHCSPDRVQQTRECEVEEPEAKVLRGRGGHESLDRFIAAFNLPAIPILEGVIEQLTHQRAG